MPSLLAPSVLLYRNPTFRDGLAALVELLMARHYSGHAIGRIFDHAATQGTLTGCPELDAEDEAAAEQAFVANLPAVPFDSDCWDRDEAVCLDARMLAEGSHPTPFGPTPDDFDEAMRRDDEADPVPDPLPTANPITLPPDDDDPTGEYPAVVAPQDPPSDWRGSAAAGWMAALGIKPMGGGSPEADPGRLDGDTRDFEDWLAQVDAGYPPQDQAPEAHNPRLDVGMLEAFSDAVHGPGALTAAR